MHLTPVSSLVHLRPQLHHLDATTQLERQAAASANKESGQAAGPSAARAIHMTVKSTGDTADGVSTETMADRLRAVQSEHWRTMRYTDENEEAAWEVYNESLFLRPSRDDDGEAENGKAPEAGHDQRPLEDAVPHFGSRWTDTKLLEAVSGIEKPEPEPEVKEEPKPAPTPIPVQPPQQPAPVPEDRRPKLRPRGGAAAGAVRRGGRTRGQSS